MIQKNYKMTSIFFTCVGWGQDKLARIAWPRVGGGGGGGGEDNQGGGQAVQGAR